MFLLKALTQGTHAGAHARRSRKTLIQGAHARLARLSRKALTQGSRARLSRKALTQGAHARHSRKALTQGAHARHSRRALMQGAHSGHSRKIIFFGLFVGGPYGGPFLDEYYNGSSADQVDGSGSPICDLLMPKMLSPLLVLLEFVPTFFGPVLITSI
jgi:hypothetical protein